VKILVVIEQADTGYGAYAPDLPGCVATGSTRQETLELMRGALEMHIRGLREDGEQLPTALSSAEVLEVSAA
jgi:predicted RNase H-like HicB family nuclease